jgi:hypothetical protein
LDSRLYNYKPVLSLGCTFFEHLFFITHKFKKAKNIFDPVDSRFVPEF